MSADTGEQRPYPDEIPPGAYGDDGRPRFFSDPAVDRLTAAFLDLASETWVLAERVMTIEDLLVQAGTSREAIETHQPDPDATARRHAARDAFISRVLGQIRERR